MPKYLTTAHAEGPELSPYGTPCPHVLSLTVARQHEVDALGSWLDKLPNANKLCAAICLKGLRCDDSPVSTRLGAIRMRLHSCVEEPGGDANGHEGVCAFRFLLDNYDRPWRNVFFLHGDLAPAAQRQVRKHGFQYAALLQFLEQDKWPAWPSSRLQMTREICGCGWPGTTHNAFGPVDFWFRHVTWWLGNFVKLRDPHAQATVDSWASSADCDLRHGRCTRAGVAAFPLHNGSLNSPLGYMFNLDRKSALRRSRPWMRSQYRMNLVGVRAMPPGLLGAPQAARLPAPGFDFAPLVWGHVNERLPFFQFGHEYVERPVPPCVWEGNHATMNCSQTEAPSRPHGSLYENRTGHRHRLLGSPEAKRAYGHGCDAFDARCGTTG